MVTTWAAAMRLMFSISQSDLSKSLEIFNFFQRDFSAIMAYIIKEQQIKEMNKQIIITILFALD